MTEIERIIKDREFNDKCDDLHYKFAILMDRDPAQIIWNNFDNDSIMWWFNKSIEYEIYSLAEIFKQEKEKRKI